MKNISFDEFIRYVAAVENRALQNRDEIAIKLEDGARALLKALIASSQADAALIARQSLKDAHWPLRVALELKHKPPVPRQYERGR